MNKLPKEKRDKIVLICVGAFLLCALLWYFLISSQNESIDKYRASILDLQSKVHRAEMLSKRAALVASELAKVQSEITEAEAEMIPIEQLSGNKWLLDTLTAFINDRRHAIRIVHITKDAVAGKQFLLLPKFAYSGAAYDVELRGYYHDFGKFLADFENHFPYMNVQQLQMWPVATPKGATVASAETAKDLAIGPEREQLRISLRFVVLFKPSASS
jgi:Tfp pilus assembly protein PilO